jgi:hypothetical protein
MSVKLRVCFDPVTVWVCAGLFLAGVVAGSDSNKPAQPAPPPKKPEEGLIVTFNDKVNQVIDSQTITIGLDQKKEYGFEAAKTDQIQFGEGAENNFGGGIGFLGFVSGSIEHRATQQVQLGKLQEQRGKVSVTIDGDVCSSYRIDTIKNYRTGIVEAPNLNNGTKFDFNWLETFDVNATCLTPVVSTPPALVP